MSSSDFQPDGPDLRHARFDELLIERAVAGLSPADQTELDLLASSLGRSDDDAFDHAAAALDLAFAAQQPQPVMPAELHERLLLKGQAWARAQREAAGTGTSSDTFERSIPGILRLVEPKHGDGHEFGRVRVMRRVWRSAPVWGGWLAAAACLLVAVNLWSAQRQPSQSFTARRDVQQMDSSLASLVARSPVALMDRFLNSARDFVSVPVAGTRPEQNTDVEAEVIWSPSQQTGFLKVSGLPANDTARTRYQIWVVDGSRTDPQPVDAGLFDIPLSGGKYVVPINARLPVGHPTAFAVTVESPVGTVVSKPERVILVGEMLVGPPVQAMPAPDLSQ
ncbi:MAG: anti-sigma factor domain-containing protein [Phycisphaerales bacterium]